MWWRNTAFSCALLLALGACGFKPLYGTAESGPVAASLSHIHVDTIRDRSGQFLRNHLMTALAPAGTTEPIAYNLRVALTEEERTFLLRLDETATRAELTLTAQFDLVDRADGKVVLSGKERRIAGYNLADAEYAAVVSERDAREGALRLLAQDVSRRLALHFQQR